VCGVLNEITYSDFSKQGETIFTVSHGGTGKKNILLTYCWLKFIRKELFILFFTRYCCSCLGDVLMLHLIFTTVANDVMNNRTAVLVEVLPSRYFTAVQVHCLVAT
jgi:hypothetical protein